MTYGTMRVTLEENCISIENSNMYRKEKKNNGKLFDESTINCWLVMEEFFHSNKLKLLFIGTLKQIRVLALAHTHSLTFNLKSTNGGFPEFLTK